MNSVYWFLSNSPNFFDKQDKFLMLLKTKQAKFCLETYSSLLLKVIKR
jgi:hypothetical protein